MILKGYCYFNRKIGAYTAPQFEQFGKEEKQEMMQRAFILAVDPNVRRDFSESDLCYVGEFDDKSGEFKFLDKPEFLCNFSLGGEKKDA